MEKLIRNENEAIDCLKKNKPTSGFYMLQESVDMAIQALEKVQAFEIIGTIEEFKALKEKAEPKKPEVDEFDYGEGFVCGECESFLHYVDDDDEHIRTNYCCHCGTRIDWSE